MAVEKGLIAPFWRRYFYKVGEFSEHHWTQRKDNVDGLFVGSVILDRIEIIQVLVGNVTDERIVIEKESPVINWLSVFVMAYQKDCRGNKKWRQHQWLCRGTIINWNEAHDKFRITFCSWGFERYDELVAAEDDVWDKPMKIVTYQRKSTGDVHS